MRRSIFGENYIFDPCDPYMTFDSKLLITFVAIYPLMILTKFGWYPIKHVEEEANYEKFVRTKVNIKNLTFDPFVTH